MTSTATPEIPAGIPFYLVIAVPLVRAATGRYVTTVFSVQRNSFGGLENVTDADTRVATIPVTIRDDMSTSCALEVSAVLAAVRASRDRAARDGAPVVPPVLVLEAEPVTIKGGETPPEALPTFNFTFTMPEQRAPDVHVHLPEQRPKVMKLERDRHGELTGATIAPKSRLTKPKS